MPGKKITDNFSPSCDDFLLTQPGLEPQFRRQFDKYFPNRERSIEFWVGLRQSAPLLDHAFTQRFRHIEDGERGAAQILIATIAADGFHRTTFHRLFAERFFVRTLRLLVDIRVTAVIVARKICRRRLSAKIAINALIIYVKLPSHILRILICNVSHNLLYNLVSVSKTWFPCILFKGTPI